MDERRRFERRASADPVEVLDAQTGQVVGLLADISSGGMMLRTERSLNPGQKLRLVLDLSGVDIEPGRVLIEVDVRWCEPDLDPATYVVGVRFRGMTETIAALVEAIRRRLSQAL